MTITEQKEIAKSIATSNPSVLLEALRETGHWIYSLNTVDIDEIVDQNDEHSDMMPITDDDINYVNRRDDDRSIITQEINYEDVTRAIIMEIRDYRNFKNPTK